MGTDESHFNVSLIVRDKVTRQRPQTTTFEETVKPKRNRTEVLLLTNLNRLANAPTRIEEFKSKLENPHTIDAWQFNFRLLYFELFCPLVKTNFGTVRIT